jgi:hypothetical protein
MTERDRMHMPARHPEFIKGVRMIDGKGTAFVCEKSVCEVDGMAETMRRRGSDAILA